MGKENYGKIQTIRLKGLFIMDNLKTVKSKEKVCSNQQISHHIKVIGKTI